MRPAQLIAAASLAVFAAAPVQADIIVYTDRSEFLLAAGVWDQEGFESLTATNTNALTTITSADISITANGSYLGIYDREETGGHATDGVKYLFAYNPAGGFALTWSFRGPINAVGFDIIDFEAGPSNPLAFSYAGGSFTAADTTANGAVAFFGIIDTGRTFTAFQLTSPNAAAGDGVGFDRISFGVTAVPEPSSLASAGLGLAGMAGYAGRRRRHRCFAG